MKHLDKFNYNIFEQKEKTTNPRIKIAKYVGGLALSMVLLAGSTGCTTEAKSPCNPTGENITVSISEDARIRTQPSVEDGESSNRIADVEEDFDVIIDKGDVHIVEDEINGDWIGVHASDIISAKPELSAVDVIDKLSGDNADAIEKIAKSADEGESSGLVWVNTQKASIDHSDK